MKHIYKLLRVLAVLILLIVSFILIVIPDYITIPYEIVVSTIGVLLAGITLVIMIDLNRTKLSIIEIEYLKRMIVVALLMIMIGLVFRYLFV